MKLVKSVSYAHRNGKIYLDYYKTVVDVVYRKCGHELPCINTRVKISDLDNLLMSIS